MLTKEVIPLPDNFKIYAAPINSLRHSARHMPAVFPELRASLRIRRDTESRLQKQTQITQHYRISSEGKSKLANLKISVVGTGSMCLYAYGNRTFQTN